MTMAEQVKEAIRKMGRPDVLEEARLISRDSDRGTRVWSVNAEL